MTKAELITNVAEKTGLKKKDADAVVNAVFSDITEKLVAGEKVQLIGFGTFEVKDRVERKGRNPHTGESLTIAASKHPTFTAGKTLKAAVNPD